VNGAILLPSGTMLVALTAYDQTLKFLRSTNSEYTTWELVNSDWNGGMLYRGWDVSPSGVVIAGEYPTHTNILSVRLWKITNDGRTWEVIHTFNGRQGTLTEQKQIFHIHVVQYDKYTGNYWIGTGDQDPEPSVWLYNGTTTRMIGEGTQLWRQCSFIITPKYVVWGCDGEVYVDSVRTIYTVRLDKETEQMELVDVVQSTIFNNEELRMGELYLSCGTPNEINLSNNAKDWYNVLNLTLNPDLPNAYSWFYDFVDNLDGRIFGYVTGIMRDDTGVPLTHGTVILDITK